MPRARILSFLVHPCPRPSTRSGTRKLADTWLMREKCRGRRPRQGSGSAIPGETFETRATVTRDDDAYRVVRVLSLSLSPSPYFHRTQLDLSRVCSRSPRDSSSDDFRFRIRKRQRYIGSKDEVVRLSMFPLPRIPLLEPVLLEIVPGEYANRPMSTYRSSGTCRTSREKTRRSRVSRFALCRSIDDVSASVRRVAPIRDKDTR